MAPPDIDIVRDLSEVVAEERGWTLDWLNDAAKGFLIGMSDGGTVHVSTEIRVTPPATEQLLEMKICAWRDDVDVGDARRLLKELAGNYEGIWAAVSSFLQPGRELTAKYAFDDLWEAEHGSNRSDC